MARRISSQGEASNVARRVGAPRKAPGGLGKVLFIRATPDLLAALDALAEQTRLDRPGLAISRSDVAREILYKGVRVRQGETGSEPRAEGPAKRVRSGRG